MTQPSSSTTPPPCEAAHPYEHIPAEARELMLKTADGLDRLALGNLGLSPEKVLEHAKTLNLKLSELECAQRVDRVRSRPVSIELPVAGKCNIRCTMCSLSKGSPQKPNWTLAQVQRFEPYFLFAASVNPTGVGEPLLNRDFPEMLRLFGEKALQVGFYTNATLLDEAKADMLIRSKVGTLNVSIDGATKETFEAIRHHAKFEVVVGNVRALIRRREALGAKLPRVRIAMVLTPANVHELPDLVGLAKDLGADCVYAAFVTDEKPENLTQSQPVRTNGFLAKARKVAAARNIELWAPDPLPEPSDTEAPPPVTRPESLTCLRCPLPWQQMVVWTDGMVTPCCHIHDGAHGEAFARFTGTEDPAELWNSPGMIRLRRSFRERRPPVECLRCPLMNSTVDKRG